MHGSTRGLLYAVLDDGERVPVIDVTHPAFRLDIDAHELERQVKAAVDTVRSHQEMPEAERRRHMDGLLRGSFLAPRIAAARGSVLDGISTYLLKLGPDQLGDQASAVDRAIAASVPSLSCRLRLQHMAHLAAAALEALLPGRPGAPILMLNIAGGPGMDSLNALIVLRGSHPELLEHRPIVIRILDIDAAGPALGARALDALQGAGGPLEGLRVDFQRVPFDWTRPEGLRAQGSSGVGSLPVLAVFSEGGLFDYASDDQVLAVLEQLPPPTDRGGFLAGSVSRGDGAARILNEAGQTAVRLRMLDGFSRLTARAGWSAARVMESPLSWEVLCTAGTPAAGAPQAPRPA